ncbi:MAG: cardiolipin synthase [Pseudomonadota bacterium]|nr:MAG: cardiolipin synthase [Pseudomonadota bacterium]
METTSITIFGLTFVALEAAGIAASVHAVMNVRTSQGAVAWAISLITFPFLAVPLYVVFGSRKFYGYVDARREGDLEIQHIAMSVSEKYGPVYRASFEGESLRYDAFERLAKMPFTRANDAELLVDGAETFGAIFRGIDSATDYVLVQFYIVRNDGLGRELKNRLLRKLKAGVRVCFLYDNVGSSALPGSYVEELKAAGAVVEAFTGYTRRVRRFQINFRNHRKIVVVDGHTAYVGGHNVGDEYLGLDPKLSPWRDTHVRVTGPSAITVQLSFLEDWYWACHNVPELSWTPKAASARETKVLVLPSGPADELETCGLFFVHAINAARERVWIVSPYFVPDESVVHALQLAALRGIDVRILVPHKADNRLVQLAACSYFEEMVSVGVNIHSYNEGFLHQKVMLIDDDIATVGTANFDNRSFRLNFEITMGVADDDFAGEVRRMLEADFANSRRIKPAEVTGRNFVYRAAVRAARLMAPIL